MASYHGPKAKVQRRFGEVLIPRPKYSRILDKRSYPPGEHGKEKTFRGGRRSNYGTQLDEKQKLAYIYNVRDTQLRNYYLKATRVPTGTTGGNLLILLERRLDNLVYKAGIAATIWAARQLVVHGHILVNGARIDLPSYLLDAGDVVSVSEKMKDNPHVVESMESNTSYPPYISVDKAKKSATLLRIPDETEIQIPVNVQLVVEFYNRLT
ncbi:30S ribosomal protein S4 [Aggregatilineales bacterium SYSU G02658]